MVTASTDTTPRLISDLWTVEDGRLHLHMHPAQLRAWDSKARFIAMLAGTQSGKTSFGPVWVYRELQRKGPGDYIGVTATYPLLKLKMLPEFLRLFEHTLHLGTWHAADKVFEIDPSVTPRLFGEYTKAPTRIIFGSAQNPESLESATAKAAWLDEAGQDQFRFESWEAILRRLSLSQGRALLGTTLYNLGWLKSEIYDRWLAGDSTYEVIQFPSIANPAFPMAEYERAQAVMPDWKFRLFYRGEFTRPAGMIYSCYEDKPREQGGHLVEPFTIPPEWPRFVGVDFGAVNTALVWVAHDPEAGVYYLYDESLSGDMSTKEHVAAAKLKASGVNMRMWYGGAKSEKQQRMDWSAEGIYLQEPIVSDVEAGIDRVYGLLKTFKLYVFDSCRGVRSELGTYSREVTETGDVLEKIKDKETFHRLDALRYAGQGLTLVAAAGGGIDRDDGRARGPGGEGFGRRSVSGLFRR